MKKTKKVKENEQKIAYYEEVTKRKWHKNATVLNCSFSRLTVLPELPSELKELYCYNNNLEVLPKLPLGLEILECFCNGLKVLPELPPGLTELNCTYNRLEVLPELPLGLTEFYCYNNRLEVLPELPPGLKTLYCCSNQLSVLPKLPNNLKIFDCSNNLLEVYIEIEGDDFYKYKSIGFIAGKSKYVRMGCFLRLLEDWKRNFWNNDKEFPNDNSEKSNNRYKRFLEIKNYLDKY